MIVLSWVAILPLAEAGQEKQMNENTTKCNYKNPANSVELQHTDSTKVFFTSKMSYIFMLE
jgi:hypothetical protein